MSLLDPKIDGRLKAKGYGAVFFEEDIRSETNGTWTLKLKKPELIKYFEPGDRFVQGLTEHGLPLNGVYDSSNVTFYDITSYGACALHYVAKGGSLLNVLHCKWRIADGRWFSGNRDGIHCRGYVIGPWIANCEVQAISDDAVALYARPSTILEAHPNGKMNVCVCNSELFNLEPGDEVALYAPLKGQILTECKVETVEKRPDGNWLVSFSKELPASIDTTGDMQHVTQIWNRSKSCGDFMIRHNTFRNIRRFGTVFRARRGVIEDNIYEGASTSGILFENEPQYPNGLYCSDIIIRNNQLIECSFDKSYNRPPISVFFFKLGTKNQGNVPAPDMGPRRILVESNVFINCLSPEVGLQSVRDVILRGNITVHNGVTNSIQIEKKNAENITSY